jgi:hypothetical protein
MDREALIRDWLVNLESGCQDEVTNDAFMVMSFVEPAEDPEDAWANILEGVRRASSEKVLGLIGAGALENFLAHHGGAFIDRVERETKADPRFHTAVLNLWRWKISEPVWQRLQALQATSPK